MSTTELEELVVKMSSDVSPYLKAFDEASAKTEAKGSAIASSVERTSSAVSSSFEKIGTSTIDYGKKVSDSATKIKGLTDTQKESEKTTQTLGEKFEKAGKSLKNMGSMAVDAGEALSKLTGGLDFWDSFKGFSEAEKSERGLSALIEANGREVDDTMESYKEFADEIQKTTTVEGDLVTELFKQAEALDVTGFAAKRAVKNALALAEVQGKSAESVIHMTAALEQGNATALRGAIPALRGITDETEKAAEAQRILSNMWGNVEKSADTTAGKIERVKNMWGDFKETIGGVIAEGLSPFVTLLQDVIEEFQALPQWVQKGIAITLTLLSVVGAAAVAIGGAIVAFTALSASLGGVLVSTIALTTGLLVLKVALVAGVAYAFYEVTRYITGAKDALKEFDEATEQSKTLNDAWAKRFQSNTASMLKSFDDIKDRTAKKQSIKVELDRAQKELTGYKGAIEASKKEVDELNGRWNRWTGNKMLAGAQSELDGHNKKMELARGKVEELQRAYDKIKPVEEDPEILKAISKFNDELEKQRKTFGMTSDEIKIYEIEMMGATRAMTAASREAIVLKKSIDELAKLAASAETVMKSMDQIKFDMRLDLRGLTDYEKKLKNLDDDIKEMESKLRITIPFDEEQLKIANRQIAEFKDHIKSIDDGTPEDLRLFKAMKKSEAEAKLAEVTKEAERLKKVLGENAELFAQFGKADTFRVLAHRQLESVKVIERVNKLLDQGTEITKQYLTPFEKYQQRVNELKVLLSSNAISQDTFNRAMDDAQKILKEGSKEASKLAAQLERIEAIEFDSAEAQRKIEEFVENTKQQLKQRKSELEEQRRIEEQMRRAFEEPIKMSPIEIRIEEESIKAVRKFMDELKKITDAKIPFKVPDLPPGRASGGPVSRNSLYVVGEKGPEFFSPSQSGRIIPHDLTNRAMEGMNRASDSLRQTRLDIQMPDMPSIKVEIPKINPIVKLSVPNFDNIVQKLPDIRNMLDVEPQVNQKITASTQSDKTLALDVQETNRILRSIDTTLDKMSKNTTATVGVSNLDS